MPNSTDISSAFGSIPAKVRLKPREPAGACPAVRSEACLCSALGNEAVSTGNFYDFFKAGWVRGLHLFIRVRLPYRRWLRLVILNLSSTIAVRTVVTVTDPATAIATWANLHR